MPLHCPRPAPASVPLPPAPRCSECWPRAGDCNRARMPPAASVVPSRFAVLAALQVYALSLPAFLFLLLRLLPLLPGGYHLLVCFPCVHVIICHCIAHFNGGHLLSVPGQNAAPALVARHDQQFREEAGREQRGVAAFALVQGRDDAFPRLLLP